MLLKLAVIYIIKLYAVISNKCSCFQKALVSVTVTAQYKSSLHSYLQPPVTWPPPRGLLDLESYSHS
jgi:hypothetical protein